ncbi:MAG: SDR family NAD(P)-dependent oxidoreductase [Acidobacteriota bacterium]|nr:SDR family NAD(P)-dependent oxidoreductase [Acidobacteriota bacterium]
MDSLTGKLALVTGGSRGIGRAVAVALARAGADVAINYRKSASEALAVVDEIKQCGRRGVAVAADVSDARSVDELVSAVQRDFGEIAILVNNAGIARRQAPESITGQDWDELIAVNLTSCFLMTKAVLPGMRAGRWGRLLYVSSVAAQLGGIVGPHYAASKAGMLGLMRSYAGLLAKEGITANAIAPALIETDMVTADLKATPDRIPVGRFGNVQEVAEVAVMLARNGYITGQTVNVNGGLYMS